MFIIQVLCSYMLFFLIWLHTPLNHLKKLKELTDDRILHLKTSLIALLTKYTLYVHIMGYTEVCITIINF